MTTTWNKTAPTAQRRSMRWLHLAALLLLVLGCLAKGVVTAKAAYLYGAGLELGTVSLVLQEKTLHEKSESSDPRTGSGKTPPSACVSAAHIGPLASCIGIAVPLREAAHVHFQPPYSTPHGLSAQPLDRPPRLPA